MRALHDAGHLLFARPLDERHPTLDALIASLEDREARTREQREDPATLALEARGDRLLTLTTSEGPVHLTDWLFTQLCHLSGAPREFINRLSAPLAAGALNGTRRLHGPSGEAGRLLVTANGTQLGRGLYSPRYVRVPDLEVAQAVRDAAPDFRPGGAVAGHGVGGAALPGASGLYASDRDLFLFLVQDGDRLTVGREELGSGVMVWNSEVGCRPLGFQTFLYRFVCANHIVWEAREVVREERRHVGGVRAVLDDLRAALEARRAQETVRRERARVRAATAARFAADREQAVEKLREQGFTRALAQAAVESALQDPGDLSVWGIVQGLTVQARDLPHAEGRVALERAAGQLLEAVG